MYVLQDFFIDINSSHSNKQVFPEMKTALRSYHPVPSLQKTDGNVQDAPRIKNCLKAALLPPEQKAAPPSTPNDILARIVCMVMFYTRLNAYLRYSRGMNTSLQLVLST